MATTTTITKLLFRRGNDADRKKTILASGEPGFALDTGRLYIGDGATPGGWPALSGAEYHLQYYDIEGNIDGNLSRHRLDIYVPGLSATLAGKWDDSRPPYVNYGKLFHPEDDTLLSRFPIRLTGANDPLPIGDNLGNSGGASIEFSGASDKVFSINRSPGAQTAGVINIGNLIEIDTATKTLRLGTNGGRLEVVAQDQIFAEASNTLYEDNTIDINVPINSDVTPAEVAAPGTVDALAAPATNAGIYISHMGYLSAGQISVDGGSGIEATNTILVRPPTYANDWIDGKSNLINRLKGQCSMADSLTVPRIATFLTSHKSTTGSQSEVGTWWGPRGPAKFDLDDGTVHTGTYTNMGTYQGSNQTIAKPIRIRSVRPAGQTEGPGFTQLNGSNNISVYQNATTGGIGTQKVHVTSDYEGISLTGRGARPGVDPWAGDIDLVFETGLIVYGAGDRDVQPDMNGYLINQSLDSYSFPVFQGLTLEGPLSKPMNVKSGGTGRRKFTQNVLITGGSPADDDPLNQFTMPKERFMMGKRDNSGVPAAGAFSLQPASWWVDSPAWSDAGVSFKLRYVPTSNTVTSDFDTLPASYDKSMFFDKWTTITTDGTGEVSPTRFDSVLKLQGDTNTIVTSRGPDITNNILTQADDGEGNRFWELGRGPGTTIQFAHKEHANLTTTGGDRLWDQGKTTADPFIRYFRASDAQIGADGGTDGTTHADGEDPSGGYVFSNVEITKDGHVRKMQYKSLDARYPQKYHLGNQSLPNTRSILHLPSGASSSGLYSTNISTIPDWDAAKIQATNDWSKKWLEVTARRRFRITTGNGPDGNYAAEVISSIGFNDYGTVRSIGTFNLQDIFFNKEQIADVIDNLSWDFDVHETRLDNDFLRRNANSDTAGNIQTRWLQKSSIQFGEGTSTTRTTLYQSATNMFNLKSSGSVSIDAGSAGQVNIGTSNQLAVSFNATGDQLFYRDGVKKMSVRSDGLYFDGAPAVASPRQGGYSSTTGATAAGWTAMWNNLNKFTLHGNATMARHCLSIYTEPEESNRFDHIMFCNANLDSRNLGYVHPTVDPSLQYNSLTNTLKAGFFLGNGKYLDMSENTSIPPSIELYTGGSDWYRLVGSQDNRLALYDSANTVVYHGRDGHLLCAGDVVAYHSFSDARLKTDVINLDPEKSLQHVLDLQPVSFKWKDSPERGDQIGLIAQQVNEVVPEVVHEIERSGSLTEKYKRIEYDKLVPLLIDSIKVLTGKIDSLEKRIGELENGTD